MWRNCQLGWGTFFNFAMFIVDPISNWLHSQEITLSPENVSSFIYFLLASNFITTLDVVVAVVLCRIWWHWEKRSTLTWHLTYSSSLGSGYEVCSKNIFDFYCEERDEIFRYCKTNFRTRSFLDLFVRSFWSTGLKSIKIVSKSKETQLRYKNVNF